VKKFGDRHNAPTRIFNVLGKVSRQRAKKVILQGRGERENVLYVRCGQRVTNNRGAM